MKRLYFLAALLAFSPPAHAGSSISFSVGGHRIHIEASPHCRSTSCASVSISGIYDSRRKRDRFDDDDAAPAKPAAGAANGFAAGAAREHSAGSDRRRVAATGRVQAGRRRDANRRRAAASATGSTGRDPARRRRRPFSRLRFPSRHRRRAPAAAPQVSQGVARGRAGGGRYAGRRLADRRQGRGAHRQMRQRAVRLRPQFIVRRPRRGGADQHEAERPTRNGPATSTATTAATPITAR